MRHIAPTAVACCGVHLAAIVGLGSVASPRGAPVIAAAGAAIGAAVILVHGRVLEKDRCDADRH